MHEARNRLSQHVIPVCPAGELNSFEFIEPRSDSQYRPRWESSGANAGAHGASPLEMQIEHVLDAAEKRTKDERKNVARRKREKAVGVERIPLLVHVHGGRNSPGDAVELADEILTAMISTWRDLRGEDYWSVWKYPVFIQWHSGDFATAGFRLTGLRKGRNLNDWRGWVSMPFILVNDLARGVVRLPLSLLYQWVRDAGVATRVGFGVETNPSRRDAEDIGRAMQAADGSSAYPPTFRVETAEYERALWQHSGRFISYFPTQIFLKIPLQLVIEGLGQGAWDVMRRRASHLVWLPSTYERPRGEMSDDEIRAGLADTEPNGVLPSLYREIGERGRDGTRYSLTLVAHSMGAIAVNDSLRCLEEVIESSGDMVEVERIIYMAPACTVDHAVDCLVPFLEEHEDVKFHFLALHPIAEADEINKLDLVQRGSLLEWIDTYYTNHANHSERVFGKWSNALPALGRFQSVRERVTFKAFDVDGRSTPQKHGEFNRIPFWLPTAYDVAMRPYDDDEREEFEERIERAPSIWQSAPSFRANWLGTECQDYIEDCTERGVVPKTW